MNESKEGYARPGLVPDSPGTASALGTIMGPGSPSGQALRNVLAFWRRYPGRMVIAALVLLGLRTFVGEASVVPTGSMEGTILVGDHLFLNKLPYGPEIPLMHWRIPVLKTIRRGDIVVFRYPRNPEEAFLKRVIAVSGDRVEIRNGVLYIDSSPVNEPYVIHRNPRRSAVEEMGPVVVPPGSLFVMGDNRDNSSDKPGVGVCAGAERDRRTHVRLLVV